MGEGGGEGEFCCFAFLQEKPWQYISGDGSPWTTAARGKLSASQPETLPCSSRGHGFGRSGVGGHCSLYGIDEEEGGAFIFSIFLRISNTLLTLKKIT